VCADTTPHTHTRVRHGLRLYRPSASGGGGSISRLPSTCDSARYPNCPPSARTHASAAAAQARALAARTHAEDERDGAREDGGELAVLQTRSIILRRTASRAGRRRGCLHQRTHGVSERTRARRACRHCRAAAAQRACSSAPAAAAMRRSAGDARLGASGAARLRGAASARRAPPRAQQNTVGCAAALRAPGGAAGGRRRGARVARAHAASACAARRRRAHCAHARHLRRRHAPATA
jgi:hypothetical protein